MNIAGIIVYLALMWMYAVIIRKAGFSPWWVLLAVIPPAGLIAYWISPSFPGPTRSNGADPVPRILRPFPPLDHSRL